jgi:putative hydrolase of the HAD superfamily
MSEPAIRGVTIDWWHTIAETPGRDYDDQMRRMRVERIGEALADVGLVTDSDALYKAYDKQGGRLAERWGKAIDLSAEKQVDAFLRFAGIPRTDPALRQAVASAFGEAMRARLPSLYPNIEALLAHLQTRGYRIGLVSNTGRTWGRYLRPIQDELGIGKYFDVRVFSDEVGVRKPRAEIFQRALDGLELPADRVVHIGDDVDADIEGAKGVGMRAIWFNTGFWPNARTTKADAEVSDHMDVPEVLERWRP